MPLDKWAAIWVALCPSITNGILLESHLMCQRVCCGICLPQLDNEDIHKACTTWTQILQPHHIIIAGTEIQGGGASAVA